MPSESSAAQSYGDMNAPRESLDRIRWLASLAANTPQAMTTEGQVELGESVIRLLDRIERSLYAAVV